VGRPLLAALHRWPSQQTVGVVGPEASVLKARALPVSSAARVDGWDGSPSSGSECGEVSGLIRMASNSPTLGRIGAPQPSR